MIGPTAWLVMALGATVALGGTYWRGYKQGEGNERTRQELVIANLRADAETRLKQETSKVLAASSELQKLKDQNDLERQKAQSNNARIATGLASTRTERDGLRDRLTAALAGGVAAGDDTIGSCRSRASVAGVLLDEGMQLQEELAGAAESCSADLRAMRQWADSIMQMQKQ